MYAHKEASEHYETALELLEPHLAGTSKEVLRQRGKVLERLGDEAWFGFETDTAFKRWEETVNVYGQIGERVRSGDVYRKMASLSVHSRKEPTKTLALFDKALDLLESERASLELGNLYLELAFFQYSLGKFDLAKETCTKSLNLAKKLKIPEIEAQSYLTLGILVSAEEKERLFEDYEKALEIGIKNNLGEVVQRAYNNLGAMYLDINGDCDRAEKMYHKAMEYARKYSNLWWQTLVGLILCQCTLTKENR